VRIEWASQRILLARVPDVVELVVPALWAGSTRAWPHVSDTSNRGGTGALLMRDRVKSNNDANHNHTRGEPFPRRHDFCASVTPRQSATTGFTKNNSQRGRRSPSQTQHVGVERDELPEPRDTPKANQALSTTGKCQDSPRSADMTDARDPRTAFPLANPERPTAERERRWLKTLPRPSWCTEGLSPGGRQESANARPLSEHENPRETHRDRE